MVLDEVGIGELIGERRHHDDRDAGGDRSEQRS
jgi:hypothetical protein